MKKIIISILAISFLCFPLASEPLRQITVFGFSKAQLIPDILEWNINIRSEDESLEATKDAVLKSSDFLVQTLERFGIEKGDIFISAFQHGPNHYYDNGVRKQNGYYSERDVVFSLKELDLYSDIMSSLSEDLNIKISYVGRKNTKEDQVRDELKLKALLDAKQRASSMCETLGMKLLDPIEITDGMKQGIFRDDMPFMGGAASAPSRRGDISLKVIEIESSVTVVFEIGKHNKAGMETP